MIAINLRVCGQNERWKCLKKKIQFRFVHKILNADCLYKWYKRGDWMNVLFRALWLADSLPCLPLSSKKNCYLWISQRNSLHLSILECFSNFWSHNYWKEVDYLVNLTPLLLLLWFGIRRPPLHRPIYWLASYCSHNNERDLLKWLHSFIYCHIPLSCM